MNENWPEIVETLIPYFETNSVEGDYQREIENCLKFLGWKKTNGTMVSQYTLPIGNSNSIRPDIVLWRKNEHDTQSPVLPIEIKRPSNIQNERQENQLMSYMRQLKLNVGLYIGEKIQLYYDIPNDGENPICVFTAEFKKEDVNGSIICDLLTYDKFNLGKIETFCNEQYKKIQARNNLHRRVSEFLSEGNGVKNIISLLKDKFTAEGFEESAINEEFANLTLTVHYENKSILPSLQLKTRQTSKNSQNDYKESDSKDHTKFSLDGINFYVKRRFVLEVIKHYIKDHPIYYAGPAKTPQGMACGSMGPTTAGRMDPYVDLFQSHGGSMIMLAKGNRSQQVTDACQKYGGFYLGSIGGPAAILAQNNIKSIECVEYPELGMEAIWKIEVENFPAFILVDDKGNDFFKQLKPWNCSK